MKRPPLTTEFQQGCRFDLNGVVNMPNYGKKTMLALHVMSVLFLRMSQTLSTSFVWSIGRCLMLLAEIEVLVNLPSVKKPLTLI
jgi:hypothetical protein